jgi:enterochelin esterase family protein
MQRQGRVVEAAYPSALSGQELPLRVYLPPCYDQGQARYPLVILFHGFPFDQYHWSQVGVEAVVEEGIQQGRWAPMLLAMPGAPDALYVSTDGGAGSYEQEVMESLLPHLQRNYRIQADADHLALAGISRGGVWALEIGLRHPDVFGRVGALSPALHVNRARPAYDPFWLVENGESFPALIFLSAGRGEPGFLEGTQALHGALLGAGVEVHMLETDGGHDDPSWMAVLPELFRRLSAGWASGGGGQP